MAKKERFDEITTKNGQEILKNLQSLQTELSLQFERCGHKFSQNGTISISDHLMVLLARGSQSIRSRGPNIT